MLLSIVVPTRNSSRTIRACLTAILEQTYPTVEVVVADNNSADATARIASSLADVLLVAGPERSAQRNAGAAVANGKALMFIDSDMELAPGVAASCVELIAAGHASVVIPEKSFGQGFWARCKVLERRCYVGDSTIEAARCFSREAFETVGGYDERIVAGPEDWDIAQRVVSRFGPPARCSEWICHDEGHLTLMGTLKTKFYYGRSAAGYVRRHPGATRRQIARPAFLRRGDLLAREPLTAAGMLSMKALEYAAGGAGLLVSLVARRARRR